MKIILLTGVIGSGKDYWAKQYIKEHPNETVKCLHFIATLRDIIEGLYNLPKGDEEAYTAWKSKPENRSFMVALGREIKRVYGDDFFATRTIDTIWNDMDICEKIDTYLISDFRFPIEFWTLFNAFPDKLEITFCDFHSDRYELRPEQVSEQMAIWLLSKGLTDREKISVERFAELMKEYEELNR